MNNTISVTLFRVSNDSNYLDMIFECPKGARFDSFILDVRYVGKAAMKRERFDLTNSFFKDSNGDLIDKQKWVIRMPLSAIDMQDTPAIYTAQLHASYIEEETQIDSCTMVCSDVNYAYRCMLKDILDNSCNKCACESVISDDTILKYILLYGHQAALNVEDYMMAETYFKIIGNCFSKCGDKNYSRENPCGCHD